MGGGYRGSRMKKNEERDSTSRFENLSGKLVEVIKTGIVLTDTDGRIRFANDLATKLLAYSREELKDKPIHTLFLHDDVGIFLPNIMKMTAEKSGFEGEALLRRQDGTTFFVSLATTLYKEDDEDYQLIIFTFQDISHLKRMQREYVDSDRFAGLGMMTDQISHQIRNPLVSICGFALRLAKETAPRDEYAHYAEIIQSEARRLESIIDRLVELAQVGKAGYRALTLPQIFEGVEKLFDARPDGLALRIRFPEPDTLPRLRLFGDERLLIRALECAVRNGLDALSGDGEVAITGEIIDHDVVIGVRDNGEGILPETLPFIFDPFFTTRFNCLGLGLTMARRIIQEHKGRIEVQSIAGKGTETRILFPIDRRREIRTKLL